MAKSTKKNDSTNHIKDILANTKDIMISNASLATLLDFERVLSELDLYSFANWKSGELVSGPENEKYFVTCKFMWPENKMPDPRGGERLLGYDCKITYQKSKLNMAVEVKTADDFKDGTKMPKMVKAPIWVVSITLPRKLLDDVKQSMLDVELDNTDTDEIANAYQTGESESEGKDDSEEAAAPDEQDMMQQEVPEELPK